MQYAPTWTARSQPQPTGTMASPWKRGAQNPFTTGRMMALGLLAEW